MAQAASIDELFNKKPATATVEIIVDSDLAERWHQVNEEWAEARLRRGEKSKEAVEAEDVVEELRPAVDAAKRTIKLKSIGRKGYDALMAAHPATAEQKKEARKDNVQPLAFDPEAFLPALFAASAVEPQISSEEALELYNSESYNADELNTLFTAALQVNRTSKVVSLGKG